jgi:hypothetical protein
MQEQLKCGYWNDWIWRVSVVSRVIRRDRVRSQDSSTLDAGSDGKTARYLICLHHGTATVEVGWRLTPAALRAAVNDGVPEQSHLRGRRRRHRGETVLELTQLDAVSYQ